MARRSSTTKPEASTQAEATPEATEEASVTSTTTEAPATESKDDSTEPEIDLTAFKAAVETAMAEKDSSTGELPLAAVEPVVSEYRALNGLKAKNKAKEHLNQSMKDSMNNLEIQSARAFLQLSDAVKASGGGGHKAEKAPADPTEAFVQRMAGLRLAINLASSNVPEGVAEDWKDKATSLVESSTAQADQYLTWVNDTSEDKGDAPEVTALVKSAVKLAQGKAAKVGGSARSGGTFTGERRDIGKHIAEAFDSVEPGTFLTVAQIRSFKSDEYGDNPPSAGAISARLFPTSGKCTVEGVEPGKNEKGNKGATKVA